MDGLNIKARNALCELRDELEKKMKETYPAAKKYHVSARYVGESDKKGHIIFTFPESGAIAKIFGEQQMHSDLNTMLPSITPDEPFEQGNPVLEVPGGKKLAWNMDMNGYVKQKQIFLAGDEWTTYIPDEIKGTNSA